MRHEALQRGHRRSSDVGLGQLPRGVRRGAARGGARVRRPWMAGGRAERAPRCCWSPAGGGRSRGAGRARPGRSAPRCGTPARWCRWPPRPPAPGGSRSSPAPSCRPSWPRPTAWSGTPPGDAVLAPPSEVPDGWVHWRVAPALTGYRAARRRPDLPRRSGRRAVARRPRVAPGRPAARRRGRGRDAVLSDREPAPGSPPLTRPVAPRREHRDRRRCGARGGTPSRARTRGRTTNVAGVGGSPPTPASTTPADRRSRAPARRAGNTTRRARPSGRVSARVRPATGRRGPDRAARRRRGARTPAG